MGLPIEIMALIVGYVKECPNYMRTRQIDRQFRYVCQFEKFEARFASIVNERFSGNWSFKQLITEWPVLLWFRLVKQGMLFRNYASKFDGVTYLWGFNSFPNNRGDTCIWGTAITDHATKDFFCYRRRRAELVILRNPRSTDDDEDNSQKRLCTINTSVPGNKPYRADHVPWVEYDVNSRIPFKYITLTGLDAESCDTPVDFLIQMIDVWHKKRLDIYLTWPRVSFRASSSLRFVAVTFSKYGLLIITCYGDPTVFLLVGKPQYLGQSNELDMSLLFEYFHYIISNRLATLVTTIYHGMSSDDSTFFKGPEFYPLTKDHWFGTHDRFFHIPPQSDVPTYEDFLVGIRNGSMQPASQTSHMSLILDMSKYENPKVSPDKEILLTHIVATAPICDNTFILCNNIGDSTPGVVDVRPSFFDVTVKSKKLKLLKIPKHKAAGYVSDYFIFRKKNDWGYCYYSLEAP